MAERLFPELDEHETDVAGSRARARGLRGRIAGLAPRLESAKRAAVTRIANILNSARQGVSWVRCQMATLSSSVYRLSIGILWRLGQALCRLARFERDLMGSLGRLLASLLYGLVIILFMMLRAVTGMAVILLLVVLAPVVWPVRESAVAALASWLAKLTLVAGSRRLNGDAPRRPEPRSQGNQES